MQRIWYRLPLALKIAVPMALFSLLSALTIVAVTQYSQQRLLHERTDSLGNALASRLAASSARPLVQNDAVSLQAALAGFTEEPVVQRAVVFDLKQQLVAAAGDEKPDTWDYSTTIHWQDSAVGRAVLSLRPSTTRAYYPQLGDLLMLSAILTALSAVCGLWLGHNAEAVLVNLTRKLSGEQIDLDYRGTDALARVLDTPLPPLLTPETEPVRSGAFIAQLFVPNASEENCQQALTLTETIGQLYGGKAHISRAGGIAIRFPADDEFEGPFRALCCAELLKQIGAEHHYRIALAALSSADDGNLWREQELIENLHRACEFAAENCAIQIDAQLQRHPAINQRCTLTETENNFWQVTALLSPYDTLLDRQINTLRSEWAAETSVD